MAWLLLLVGMLAGTFIGVIPGLGGAVLLTMLLPFLYGMPVVPAIALMLAAHASIYFSGSITAILFNTPGAPESAATTYDGYAMTKQGRAARALGVSATATTFGGWVGFVILVLIIPEMYLLLTLFHPPEYLMLAILAVVLISQLKSASLTKGLLSGLFGLMLSLVGYDPVTGVQRFSFDILSLYNGINISVVALGLFAFSEMYYLYGANRAMAQGVSVNFSRQPGARVWDGVRDVFSHVGLTIRSSLIGVLVGLVPGVGGVAGNFIAYGQAMRTSKHPERFGQGTPEGIIAPEASSLSKEAGSLVPAVALGVPGTVGMAVLMSAFTILGLVPGPTMLTHHLPLVFSMAWVLAITSLFASLIGLFLAPVLARLTAVPGPVRAVVLPHRPNLSIRGQSRPHRVWRRRPDRRGGAAVGELRSGPAPVDQGGSLLRGGGRQPGGSGGRGAHPHRDPRGEPAPVDGDWLGDRPLPGSLAARISGRDTALFRHLLPVRAAQLVADDSLCRRIDRVGLPGQPV